VRERTQGDIGQQPVAEFAAKVLAEGPSA
jgi:hypothetical protein